MRRLAFLQKEPLSRFGVAFLLTAGVSLPLLLALGLSGSLVFALVLALAILLLLTVLNATPRSRKLLWIGCGVTAALQFFLPRLGLFGSWAEAFKALALYFSGYTVALPLFAGSVASLLTTLAAVLSYVFAKRGVGFLPAALVVVLVMFGLWSLGKGELFWYAAPALVALLLQMSQSAHEKINVLHVLPVAAATVLLAFLLLPGGRLTIQPLANAASSLKQMISDYLFFTEPRNVFTLGTYGYYPMGSGQLGGAAEPSEYPVMMVKTDQKVLLRAVAKDQYTGRSFVDTSSAKRYLYINPRWQAQRRKVFLETLPSDAIRKASTLLDQKAITIQMENRAASTVFTPLFLRNLQMENDMVAYFNDASELFITRDLQQGDRYTVYTPVVEGGQTGLDALVNASLKDDLYYTDIFNAYTQLPSHLEQKVFDDAQNIVKGAETPYAKAMAIMRHLQKYYRYTLTPDTPPDNKDFITYFLYVGKEGYCTYFASAMTVLCRMANLPARYVEGFLAQPSSDGFAYVTGKDAHAWTEVYFEGFGWVPFDPTPQQQDHSSTPPQGNQSPEPTPTPSPAPQDQPTETPNPDQPEDQPSPPPQPSDEPDAPSEEPQDAPPEPPPDQPFPWWILIGIAALLGLEVRVSRRSPEHMAKRAATEKEKIFLYGAAVQHLLTYAHRAPKPGETPLLFARRIDDVHAFPTPITPLWRILALSNYSRMEPSAEQTRRAEEIYRHIFRGSHPIRRLRLLFSAAFNPRFYRALDTPAPRPEPPKGPSFHPPKPPGGGKTPAYTRNGARPGDAAPSAQPRGTAPRRGPAPGHKPDPHQPDPRKPDTSAQAQDGKPSRPSATPDERSARRPAPTEKPSGNAEKPSLGTGEPSEAARKPSDGPRQPSGPAGKPPNASGKPSGTTSKPTDNPRQPSDARRPSDGAGKSADGSRKPTSASSSQAANHNRPVRGKATSAAFPGSGPKPQADPRLKGTPPAARQPKAFGGNRPAASAPSAKPDSRKLPPKR